MRKKLGLSGKLMLMILFSALVSAVFLVQVPSMWTIRLAL